MTFLDGSGHEELLRLAFEAREGAYAPYSGFAVGAAIRSKNGSLFSGCNIENGSFGLTICAERVALFKAVSAGEKEFEALAVVADSEGPVYPCGACRQVLSEFKPDLTVIMSNLGFKIRIMKLTELLPYAFVKP
jgi:cytidine deaminase